MKKTSFLMLLAILPSTVGAAVQHAGGSWTNSGVRAPVADETPTPTAGDETPTPAPTPVPEPIVELITSFYGTILGREPEPGAVDTWYKGYFLYAMKFNIDVRFIPREMARLFFLSEEYAARNRTNGEFITDCYVVFLNRTPSEAELANWLNGVWNRSQVMTVFSESQEFADRIEEMHPRRQGHRTKNFVTTMYIGLLDRLVDVGGLVHWANIFDHTNARGGLEAVRAAAKQMASDVIRSREFLSKDPQPADYVVRLYRSFLGRFPSDTEVGVWTGEVAAGRQTYDTLIQLFGDADEFSQQLEHFFGPLPTPSPTPAVTATPTPAVTATPTPAATGAPTATPTAPSEPVITVTLGPAVQLRLIRIPAGSFQMGSPDTERSRGSDEGPVHTVTIGGAFYMSEHEVTQKQWVTMMTSWPGPEAPSNAYGLGDDYPAYLVSWTDCQGFITNVNSGVETTGQLAPNFRLPTEAEWEYVCRAGTETRFFFGDSLAAGDGNTNGPAEGLPGNRSDYMWFGANNSPNGSKQIGGKQPNQFGLYNMSGNVAEWCQDVYHSDYTGAPTDGSAWELPTGDHRVARGGSWDSTAAACRSAARGGETHAPNERNARIGFRVVWAP